MYLFYIFILLWITLIQCSDFLVTDNSNDVIHFYSRLNASTDFVVIDCFAGRASYQFKSNHAVTVVIFSDKPGSAIIRCDVFNNYYYPDYSATVRRHRNGIYKTEIYISDIGDKHFDLKCYYGNPFGQLWCGTHVTITDIEEEDGFYDLTGHTMVEIARNYYEDQNDNNSVIPIRDVNYYDNSSLSVTCELVWKTFAEDLIYYTITRKAENQTILEEGSKNVASMAYFIKRLDESYNNNELYCMLTSFSSRNEQKNIAKIVLKYQRSGSTKYDVITTKQIIACVGGVLILLVFIVTLFFYLWYRVYTAKRKKQVQKTVQDRLSTSDIYENPYDVVYEDRLRVQCIIDKEVTAEVSTRPPPPPIDTIPYKKPTTRTKAPTAPNEGSLIPASDMYLLHIDSDGYEIPLADRAKYIRNLEVT